MEKYGTSLELNFIEIFKMYSVNILIEEQTWAYTLLKILIKFSGVDQEILSLVELLLQSPELYHPKEKKEAFSRKI